jgi:GAF domain-containing protein
MTGMTVGPPAPDWLQVFADLLEVSSQDGDLSRGLSRVVEVAGQILGSRACTIVQLDLKEGHLKTTACDSEDPAFAQSMLGRIVTLEPGGAIDAAMVEQREAQERYGLSIDGQGVASADIARRYRFESVLCHPLLKGDGALLGYLNHFSATTDRFSDETRQTLRMFARVAAAVIARSQRQRTFERSVGGLNQLSKDLLVVPERSFLNQLAVSAAALLSAAVCIVWQRTDEQQELGVVAATDSVDKEMRTLTLELGSPSVRRVVERRGVKYIADVRRERLYGHGTHAAQRGWVSMLSVPLMVGDELIGMIDIYTKHERQFDQWEREFFGIFANYAALSISEFASRARLLGLNKLMGAMTEVRSVDELLRIFLGGALALVRTNRGSISRLDLKTGELRRVLDLGDPPHLRTLQWGEGVTGWALERGEPVNVADVTSPEWKSVYIEFWPDTRSELAIPIVVRDAQVRVGIEPQRGTKPIGVLNVESPRVQAFSEAEADLLWSLAQHAAIVIERLEFDDRLARLRASENRMGQLDTVEEVAQEILDAVSQTLGYDFVNISLVNAEKKSIKTEFLLGIPEERYEEFKRMADHSLESDDIQAHIVRQGIAEVPPQRVDAGSPFSFDDNIYNQFGHERLIRLFVPMRLPQGNRVVGTIEAGYNQTYRRFIYERDVNMLQGFADYAALALDQKNLLHFNFLVAGFLREGLATVSANQGSLLLLNTETNALEVIERKGRPFAAGNVRLAIGQGIAGLAVRDRKPYRMADVTRSESFVHPKRGEPNFKSMLAVPLIHGDRAVGALCAHHEEANRFTQADEDKLVELCQSIAPTIEQLGVDAFVGHTQRLKALERFHNVAEELGRLTLNPEKLREEIVKAAETVLEAGSVILYEYFQAREAFMTPTMGGDIRDRTAMTGTLSKNRAPYRIVRAGASHYCVATAQDDFMRGDAWKRPDGGVVRSFVERESIVSSAGILLKAGDEVMGVLFLNYRVQKEFSFTEKHIIGGFAADAALALQEARAVGEAMKKTRQSAIRRNQLKMAHRLKAPLASISQRLRDIRGQSDDLGKVQRLAKQAVELSVHVQRLLAEFNRLGTRGPLADVRRLVRSEELLRLLENTMARNRTRSDTQTVVSVDPSLAAVHIDPEALEDDLINLLHDSERHADGPSRVTVVTSRAMREDCERCRLPHEVAFLKLVYEDDGPGVPNELKERIFEEKFSTVSGTGLGLAIARENATRMGGAIVERGTYGEGVRFEMYFPLADSRDSSRT